VDTVSLDNWDKPEHHPTNFRCNGFTVGSVTLSTTGPGTHLVKFFVRRKTRKVAYDEYQEHGYEIDLVAARARRLILAEVKSYLGSQGVSRQGFRGLADETRHTDFDRFKVLNDPELRAEVTALASERYKYKPHQVEWRLYVGKFAAGHEDDVRAHLENLEPPVHVVALPKIVDALVGLADKKTYTDDPVIMTVKALAAANRLVT
jgi:hypothetical protein